MSIQTKWLWNRARSIQDQIDKLTLEMNMLDDIRRHIDDLYEKPEESTNQSDIDYVPDSWTLDQTIKPPIIT